MTGTGERWEGPARWLLVVLVAGLATSAPMPDAYAQQARGGAARIRLPATGNPTRKFSYRGQQVTLKEFAERADPNERIKLRSGEEVTLQQFADAMEELQKVVKTSITAVPRKRVAEGTTRQQRDQDLAKTRAQAERLRVQQQNQWNDVIQRKRGAGRKFDPSQGIPNAVEDLPQASAPVEVGSGAEVLAKTLPKPVAEPAEVVWSDSFGSKGLFGAVFALGAGNDFAPKGEAPMVVCGATAEVTAHAFGMSQSIVRAVGGGNATPTAIDAGAAVYLLGQSKAAWSKKGTVSLPKWNKVVSTPSFGATFPILGPLGVKLAGTASGEAGLSAELQPGKGPEKAGCQAAFKPYLKLSGSLTGTPNLPGVTPWLSKFIQVGVTGSAKVVDVSMPSSLSLAVLVDKKNGVPLKLVESADVAFPYSFLAATVTLWLEVDAPGWALGWFQTLFDVDGNRWEQELVNWEGNDGNWQMLAIKGREITFAP
jgi:hypothetical protein